MELWLVVDHNLNLLACLCIESVAHGGILCGDVLCKRYVLAASLLHGLRTLYELGYVEACAGNRQQAYGSEYGEASAYVVGDDE